MQQVFTGKEGNFKLVVTAEPLDARSLAFEIVAAKDVEIQTTAHDFFMLPTEVVEVTSMTSCLEGLQVIYEAIPEGVRIQVSGSWQLLRKGLKFAEGGLAVILDITE